jgi:carboxyl-terminal processing protease
MFKRILILLGAALLGFAACVGSMRMAGSWSLFPNRDLDRSSAYIKEVMKTVNENYVDPKASGYEELARLSIHGMVDSLDPHSQYLESKDNAELEEDLDGEYGGIGVEVEMHKGAFSVINPIPGSPGERAGIQLGDEIVSIDGKAVERGGTMDHVVDELRGKPHTHVRIGLVRPSNGRHLDLDLVREVIKVISVRGTHVIDGTTTGYIQITEFSDHTGEQFDDALNDLLKRGIDSLVIDLRNNPGGLIDAAVEVAEPFFRKGELIVYTLGRKPEDRDRGGPPAAAGRRPHQRRQRQRRRDRDRRPQGLGPGGHRRGALLRQGLGPDDLQAEERRGPAADDRPLLHPQRHHDQRAGHHPPGRGRDDDRGGPQARAPDLAPRRHRPGGVQGALRV